MKIPVLLRGIALALALHAPHARADTASETRAAYLAVIERPHVAPAAQLDRLPDVDGLAKYHLWFQSDARERVPGYLLMPDSARFEGRRPVVIALHGTGGSKDDMANFAGKAARAGFIAVTIDGRFHGERTAQGHGAKAYNEAIARAFATGEGHPFYYDTTYDVMRLVDYLVTRPDVDAQRIGLTGVSKGGIETYLTAAADPRIAAAVAYIGVQSFAWALENGQWQARIATIQDGFDAAARQVGKSPESVDFVRQFYARVVPGIDGRFDGPAMLPLIAPRPLLVVNGDSDANTPIASVRLAVNAARTAYIAAHAADNLKLVIEENTPHRVNPEQADAGIAWFVAHLAPESTKPR